MKQGGCNRKYTTTKGNYSKNSDGDIMLLIPGLAIFTSIYDIVKGDTTSGTNRFVDGIFLALSIASGIAISLLLGGKLWL